ncbi:MAG: DUF3067 family protein [Pseudanabaenaceae cyanobacterium bins.68]|nr:DUF3067 family protein [Pseudanabaenaceae cyanobacterium bins.68]
MNALALRQLLLDKWGYSYDLQIRRQSDRLMFLVMWRYQEQASFPLTELEYLQHLEAIAARLSDWGTLEQVQQFILTTKTKPRLGKALCLPLKPNQRASEWV